MATKNKKSLLKTIIIAVFFAVIVLVYYFSLNHSVSNEKKSTNISEKEELMQYDMIADYPKTPRETVKLHCRYYKLLYNSELTDEEIVDLNKKMMKLYSSELLSYNTESVMVNSIKDDIKKVEDEGYSYKAFTLPETSQITRYEQNGVNMASMEVTVTVGTKEKTGYVYQQYVLVEEEGQWKIYGWGQAQSQSQKE